MSAPGAKAISWANGEDRFCFSKVGEILDLEEKCGAIGGVMHRLRNGNWSFSDVRETIRLGLIGGGMSPEKAMAAVNRHVDPPDGRPLAESAILAFKILAAAVVGVPDDPVGKAPPAEEVRAGSSTTTVASDGPK